MAKQQANRYLGLEKSTLSLSKFRNSFINHHSKFIHSSWLILEDLDKEVTINDIAYTIFGMWDTYGSPYDIMLKPVNGGLMYLASSNEISRAMGYKRMRNLVTGIEHTWDMEGSHDSLSVVPLIKPVVNSVDNEDADGEWNNPNDSPAEESEDFVDPLVKALQDDITDDGDTSNFLN
jgi:hypothetical protein